MIRIFSILVALLLFVSCSDSLYSEDSSTSLKQFMYVVPENYSSDVATSLYPVNNIVVEKGQNVKFVAGYSINDELTTSDTAAKYYTSVHWVIDGEYIYANTFRYTFKKSGPIQGELRTIDLFGDTLVSEISIHVNTPEKFTIDFPYNGYNLAEPSKSVGLPFKWTISGIDQWESADCEIFLSDNQYNVWTNSLGVTDCGSNATLWGPLVGDSAQMLSMDIDLRKVYYTFYWGIKYTVYTDGTKKYSDTTSIYNFTTKFLDDEKTLLYVPLVYQSMRFWDSTSTEIIVVSASGDTLASVENTRSETTIPINLKPQSGATIYFKENQRPEYTAEPVKVDLPPGAVITLDTIVFRDLVSPQLRPINDFIEYGDLGKFIVYDDGSGINPQKLKVFSDQDSLFIKTIKDTLAFVPSCENECKLTVKGEDYARNSLPNLYWEIVRKSEGYFLYGPYKKLEEQP